MIHDPLERPWLYRLATRILAPGGGNHITMRLRELVQELAITGRCLDVGCGPSSWLWPVGLHPVGLDYSSSYVTAYQQKGKAVRGDASRLPFTDGSFSSVWSVGLLHHLGDDAAHLALNEMLRLCHERGSVVVLDAVLPESAWRRPFAFALRRLDRGGFVRREEDFRSLLPLPTRWSVERHTYTQVMGLEIVVCRFVKKACHGGRSPGLTDNISVERRSDC
jgi:ubiquinone/menaquinone biosynthesis C-methylase UbiE